MNINKLVSALRAERDRLDKAIAAIAGINSIGRGSKRRGARRMSAAGRKRLSELLKKRWASGKMGRRRRAKAA